jgi:putative two-component system response regulator
LDADEWVVMRSHPLRGEDICRPMKSLAPVLPIIRHHHERWDGGGYPDGLRGEQIPLLARVVQIADIYDALVSPRPYKPAFPSTRAMEILQEECNKGWRDPALVSLFRDMHDDVIAPLAAQPPGMEPGSMQSSLSNLQRMLSA